MEVIRLPLNQGGSIESISVVGQHRNHCLQMLKPALDFEEWLVGDGQT